MDHVRTYLLIFFMVTELTFVQSYDCPSVCTINLKDMDKILLYQGFLLQTWIISAWISNHVPGKVWEEINYPFPNFTGCTVEFCEWISRFTPHVIMDVITIHGDTKHNKAQRSSNTTHQSCVYFNSAPPSAAYMCRWTGSALVQIIACRLVGAKPLSEPKLEYC